MFTEIKQTTNTRICPIYFLYPLIILYRAPGPECCHRLSSQRRPIAAKPRSHIITSSYTKSVGVNQPSQVDTHRRHQHTALRCHHKSRTTMYAVAYPTKRLPYAGSTRRPEGTRHQGTRMHCPSGKLITSQSGHFRSPPQSHAQQQGHTQKGAPADRRLWTPRESRTGSS